VKKLKDESEEAYEKRELEITKNQAKLTQHEDNFASCIEMYTVLSESFNLEKSKKGTPKLNYKDNNVWNFCKKYNLNRTKIIEVIKNINNNIKATGITKLASFSKVWPKVYEKSKPILEKIYADFILSRRSKNNY